MPKTTGRPITLKDIAKLAGLSIPAVSLSLLDNPNSTVKISGATRQKVRLLAEKMGYRPNLAAQSLSKGTTQSVGIIAFQTASAQTHVHIREARPIFSEAGLSSVLYFVEERSAAAVQEACHAMIDARVDGVLLYLPLEQSIPGTFDALKQFGLPIASIGGPRLDGISRYSADEREGFVLLTEHLLQEGYCKIDLVTSEEKATPARKASDADRNRLAVEGYQKAIKKARQRGAKVVSRIHRLNLAAFSNALPLTAEIDEHYLLGYMAMRRLIEMGKLPEALIFQADGKALGAMRACSEAGIRIPEQVAIAGFNDDRSCSAGYATLTSVALPLREMTRLAAADLIKRINGKADGASRPASLSCKVMVRQSTSRRPLPPVALDFDLRSIFR